MKKVAVAVALVLAACSSEPIGPDPTSGTGAGGSTANTMGTGGDGGAATPGGGYESGERIKARTLVGADGSRTPAGLYDSQLEVECEWLKDSAGKTRCMPVGGSTPHFADDECTQPIVTGGACQAPAYIRTRPDDCVEEYRVFRVAGSYSGPVFRRASNASCVESGDGGAFFVTTEIEASEMVEATLETEL